MRALLTCVTVTLAGVAVTSCGDDPPLDPCEGVPCSGHGYCYEESSTPMCRCNSGYEPRGLSCAPEEADADADGDIDADGDSDGDGDADAEQPECEDAADCDDGLECSTDDCVDSACVFADDLDGDGSRCDEDCDDENPEVYPGAEELCDGIDNDCDGERDNGCPCASHWVWENPLPIGLTLNDIWHNADETAFAVGESGAIVFFDGDQWTAMPSVSNTDLNGVWSSSSSNAYTVGEDGVILHYDGIEWDTVASPTVETLMDIWGSSSSNIYAVGLNGTLIHYDGSSWDTELPPVTTALYSIHGTTPTNIYASGHGVIIHYDGDRWSEFETPTDSSMLDIWTVNDQIFTISRGTILHYDFSTWNGYSTESSNLSAIWGSSALDVYAVNMTGDSWHYDTYRWSPITISTEGLFLYGISGTSEDNITTVGYEGEIYTYNGSDWAAQHRGPRTNIVDIWGNGIENIYAVGGNTILHYNGSNWTATNFDEPLSLRGVCGIEDGQVYAVGVHIDVEAEIVTPIVLHKNGPSWTELVELNDILNPSWADFDIWAASASSVFVAGTDGAIYHFDGESWNTMASGTEEDINEIIGFSDSQVFAVGTNGVALSFNGTAWTAMSTGTDAELRGIWGTSPDNLFAYGAASTLLHYDGTSWQAMATDSSILDIWGTEDITLAIAGNSILLYNGYTWTPIENQSLGSIIWGTSVNDVRIMGSNGLIMRRCGDWLE